MLPDTLQYEYERTGKHQEGTLAGVYTTVERTMSAIGVAISGLILSIGGYVSGIGGAGQPGSAVTAIYFAVAIVPACSILASIARSRLNSPLNTTITPSTINLSIIPR